MANNLIYGLKIVTDVAATTVNAALGLYVNAGVYEIRLSEVPVTPSDYTPGIFIAEDLSIPFGGTANNGGFSSTFANIDIVLVNTDRILQQWESYGIYVSKYPIQIILFKGTDTDYDSISSTVIATCYIDSIKSSRTQVVLACTCNSISRNKKQLGKKINTVDFPYAPDSSIGKILPILFGGSNPAQGRFFKIYRTSAKQEKVTVDDLNNAAGLSLQFCYPPKMYLFPVYQQIVNSLHTSIRIGRYVYIFFGELVESEFLVGKYIMIKEGSDSLTGMFRKIVSVDSNNTVISYGSDSTEDIAIDITLQDYLPVQPNGNLSGTATDQAWIIVYDIETLYKICNETIAGFFRSETGLQLVNAVEIYGKNASGNIEPLLEYGVNVSSENNTLNVNPRMFEGELDKLISMHIVPVETIEPCTTHDLSMWGISADYDDIANGIYTNGETTLISAPTITGIDSFKDRNSGTYYQFAFTVESRAPQYYIEYYTAFSIKMPEMPANIKFNKAYLGIRGSTQQVSERGIEAEAFYVKQRGYINKVKTIFETTNINTGTSVCWIDNLPDYYYSDNVNTNNDRFFREFDQTTLISGYKKLQLIDISSKEDYDNIEEIVIIVRKKLQQGSLDITVTNYERFYELAIMFENTINIKDEVFA